MSVESHTQQNLTLSPVAPASLFHPVEKENDVLTIREAARFLRVHPDTLTRLSRKGVVPHGVIGGRYRFSRRALLAYLSQSGRQGPVKPTRKLAEYPPAKLIARVQKLGGNLALVNGRLVLEGLKRRKSAPNCGLPWKRIKRS